MKPITVGIFVALVVCQPGYAQESDERELRATVTALRSDLAALKQREDQIENELKDIRKLLETNLEALPTAKPPSTIPIAGEVFRGAKTAPVTIIEYGDFECSYCEMFMRDTFQRILRDYIATGKVKFLYRNLINHPDALPAARAAHCAGDQGKFWEMQESLFANQSTLTDKDILARAPAIGLNISNFTKCFSSQKHRDEIEKTTSDARSWGIVGTPTFLIGTVEANGDAMKVEKTFVGAPTYEIFKAEIDSLLASEKP